MTPWRGLVTVACLSLSAFSFVPPAAATATALDAKDVPLVIPPDGNKEVAIPMCRIKQDLDCIESVAVLRDGRRVEATRQQGSNESVSTWNYRGPRGEVVTFAVDARLKPTGVVESWGGRVPGARFFVSRVPDRDHPFREEEDLNCSSADRADCTVWSPPLPEGDKIEIAFRSSWIRPLNVAVRGRDLNYRMKAIPGGSLFTMSALQDFLPRVSSPIGTPIDGWEADAWMAELNFIIDHAGSSAADSAYDPRCADYGAPVAGHNAPAAGQPAWDSAGNSLNFAIGAPHLGPDQQTFRGFFQAQIPMAWLKCQSGRKDLKARGFTIQVISEDGEEQAATTTLKVKRRTLYVEAFGFHYSSPTVKLVSSR